jgi:NAD(P)-dependent dehydrogenase (short-subunit alcohol dehydrogenase family)
MDRSSESRGDAIVTEAANGTGRAVDTMLADEGWNVAALDSDEGALETLPDGLRRVRCDMTGDEASVAAIFAPLGLAGLDHLVNNAGRPEPPVDPFETLSLDPWRKMTDSHLTDVFLMTRGAVPLLRRQRGKIVDIAPTGVAALRCLAGAGFVTRHVPVVDGGMTRKMIYAK